MFTILDMSIRNIYALGSEAIQVDPRRMPRYASSVQKVDAAMLIFKLDVGISVDEVRSKLSPGSEIGRVDHEQRASISPGERTLIVVQTHGRPVIKTLRWAVVAPDQDRARIPVVTSQKLVGLESFARRALVLVRGFRAFGYRDDLNQAYAFRSREMGWFAMAAAWHPDTHKEASSFVILMHKTREDPTGVPIVIPPEAWDHWLNPMVDQRDFLRPFNPEWFHIVPDSEAEAGDRSV